MVVAGVAVSPSLISAFTLAELIVPRAAVTEAVAARLHTAFDAYPARRETPVR